MEYLTQEIGSQTVESPEQDATTEAVYQAFGIQRPESKEEKQEEPAEKTETPAIEQTEEVSEPKKITVKFNKEDKEVDVSEDKLPELAQRSLALDKERERKVEYEKALDRAAKLAGFKDHAEFLANLDNLEQASEQRQQNEYTKLQTELLDELEANGIDRKQAERYLESHPLLQQAKHAVEERQRLQAEQESAEGTQQRQEQWNLLFKEYPELAKEAEGNEDAPPWLTQKMKSRLERGYDPIDAYELAHSDKLKAQTKKQTEQKIIKQQHLGTRAQVEGQAAAVTDGTDLLPAQIALAELMGVSAEDVKKQQKLIQSRR